MRRRGKIGLAILALALAGGGAYVGMERPRPPLVIRVAAQQEEAVQAAAQEEAPRILIYHTHTYEAYEITETETYTPTEKWRTRDEQYNMVAVGDALARELTARGFIVVHDTTAFEPPNLSTAYTRSLEMLKARLDTGEQYDYWIDVHRDAYSGAYNGGNGVEIDGQSVAACDAVGGQGHWARRVPALTSGLTGRRTLLWRRLSRMRPMRSRQASAARSRSRTGALTSMFPPARC